MKASTLKKHVEREFSVKLDYKSRTTIFVVARSVFCHLAKEYCGVDEEQIATYIGRDRTNVYNILTTYKGLMNTHPNYKKLSDKIERKLNPDKFLVNDNVGKRNRELKKEILKSILELNHEQLVEFNELRLKPFKSMLRTRVYQKKEDRTRPAVRKFTLKPR